MFGDTAMLLVLAMWAKDLTGSNGVAGSVFGAVALPSLLAPFAGIVIDRFRRRTVMVVVDLATALVVLSLLLVDGREDLWLIYLVGFLYGASMIAFQSARSALLTTMLPDDQLGRANGVLGTVREALRLVGPLSGAALYAGFGGPAVAVVDAATFLLSALALAALRVREPAPQPAADHVLAEAGAGGRHLLGTTLLRRTVVALRAVHAVHRLQRERHLRRGRRGPRPARGVHGRARHDPGGRRDPGWRGGHRTDPPHRRPQPIPGLGLALTSVGLRVHAANLPVVAVGTPLFGAGLPLIVVGVTTAIQRRTPVGLQGRAFTAYELFVGTRSWCPSWSGPPSSPLVDYRIPLMVDGRGHRRRRRLLRRGGCARTKPQRKR